MTTLTTTLPNLSNSFEPFDPFLDPLVPSTEVPELNVDERTEIIEQVSIRLRIFFVPACLFCPFHIVISFLQPYVALRGENPLSTHFYIPSRILALLALLRRCGVMEGDVMSCELVQGRSGVSLPCCNLVCQDGGRV